MTATDEHRACSLRGFTLVELMLGLAITTMVALAIASMLTMVSDATSRSRDDRSVLMRANLAQVRLRSYAEPSLAMLAFDPVQGVAIWLQDDKPGSTVNLAELRVLWFDQATGSIAVERVVFPNTWTQQMKDQANVVLPKNSDFFAAMVAQRQAGFTTTKTLLETVASFNLSFPGVTLQASAQVRFALSLTSDDGQTRDVYVVVGLANHTEPTA